MKAILTSDTHYCGRSAIAVRKLLQRIAAAKPDVVFHAGDWASSTQSELRDCVARFREHLPSTRIMAVRGNHDFWDGDHDFEDLETMIENHRELFSHYRIELLEGNWVELSPGLSLAGWDGWYGHPNPPTNDARFIPTGECAHVAFRKRSEEQLDRLLTKAPAGVRIALTHFPAFSESPAYYNLCAQLTHHEFLKNSFDYLLIGHSHRRLDFIDGRCHIYNSGAEYGAPQFIEFEIPTP